MGGGRREAKDSALVCYVDSNACGRTIISIVTPNITVEGLCAAPAEHSLVRIRHFIENGEPELGKFAKRNCAEKQKQSLTSPLLTHSFSKANRQIFRVEDPIVND